MISLKKSIALSAAFVVFASASQPALAYDWATRKQAWDFTQVLKIVEDIARKTAQNTKEVERQVQTDTMQLGNRTIAALKAATGENSAVAAQQIEAQKRLMNAQEINETDRMRQQIRADAESGKYDPNPDVCLLIDLFSSDETAGTSTDDVRAMVLGAVAQQTGSDPAVQAGGTAYIESVVSDREDLAGVFDGFSDATVDTGILTLSSTLDPTSEVQREALTRLYRNMYDPNPPKPVTALEMTAPEGAYRAQQQSARATRNSPIAAWQAWNTNRILAQGPSEPLQEFVDQIPGYLEKHDLGENVSEWQQLGILNLWHYAGMAGDDSAMSAWSGDQIQKMILFQIALGNRLTYLQVEQDAHATAMLSQILSVLNND